MEVALGLAFIASGVAGLLGRTPPPSTAGAAVMMKGLAAAGYFMPALGAIQVLAGGLLVARRFVGLALVALAPVVIEILAYRLWVAGASPRMVVVALALLVAEGRLALAHKALFAPLFGRPSWGRPLAAPVPLAAGAGV